MNLAPYEDYVLTNDIIEGGAIFDYDNLAGGHMYAGGYVCERRAGRAYLLSKRKGEKRKNESGEHAGNRSGECMGNRLGECMGNRSGESAGDARESKRNDWTDKHMEGWRGNG